MVPGSRAVVCGAQKIMKTALENRPGRKILFCFQRDGVLKTVGCLKVGMVYIVMMILMWHLRDEVILLKNVVLSNQVCKFA